MKLAFFGTGEFAVAPLRSLHAAGHEIAIVVSQPDRPAGRGLQVQPTHVRVAAEALGLSHVQAADVNGMSPDELLRGATLAVIVAFGQKIGGALLAAATQGFVNIHGSLLPKYRGAAPYQWAVINGDATSGVTTFVLNERWDAGPILGRRETPIGETETADELHDRLSLLGAELIVETVAAIERGDARPLVQDATQACRAPKLSKADGVIDWSQPARVIARRINGLWSWPTATAVVHPAKGKPVQVQLARAVCVEEGKSDGATERRSDEDREDQGTEARRHEGTEGKSDEATQRRSDEGGRDQGTEAGMHAPGDFLPDGSVQTGSGRIRLIEIKPAGGKLMTFEQFANGRDVKPPARLGPVVAGV
ncbi:MAG: methionyl-tRNA formyltransferase [Phycisphaerae bacterium]